MPGSQDRKTIKERYVLDYYRQPWATRIWKSRWNWTALAVSILLVAGVYAWQRDRVFQAAPVDSVHGSFGNRCQECHVEPWQAAIRMATLDGTVHSVTDDACRHCHNSTDHPQSNSPTPACAACHQEHRPGDSLTAVADSWCTSCHNDLSAEVEGELQFHATIGQFATGLNGHPEFALLRNDVSEKRAEKLDRITFRSTAIEASGNWLDKGGLKFNHQVHLDPKGVLVEGGQRRTLACGDCHVPDASGAYMQPMLYEQHCAECHPLRFPKPLDRLETIPHASPEQVRGVLRERLANLFASERDKASTSSRTQSRLPLLPKPETFTDVESRKVDTALVRAEHALFGLEAKNGCRQCHHLEASGRSWQVLTSHPDAPQAEINDEFVAMVPNRWLSHGKFHHEKHGAVACQSCHKVAESTQTTDILLPSIDVCRQCHGAKMSAGSQPISADCVLCHNYHGEGGDPGDPDGGHGISLDALFTAE